VPSTSRNNEELAIVVWQPQDGGISEENIDINNNDSGSDHENPVEYDSVGEQPFFLLIFMILEIGIHLITKQGMF
jgi:hypothetical protein